MLAAPTTLRCVMQPQLRAPQLGNKSTWRGQECKHSRGPGASEAVIQEVGRSAAGTGGSRGEYRQVYLNIRLCHTQGSADNFITSTYKNDCGVMQMAFTARARPRPACWLQAGRANNGAWGRWAFVPFHRISLPGTALPPFHAWCSPVTRLPRLWEVGDCLQPDLLCQSHEKESGSRGREGCPSIYTKFLMNVKQISYSLTRWSN